jgi:hypothetical protein
MNKRLTARCASTRASILRVRCWQLDIGGGSVLAGPAERPTVFIATDFPWLDIALCISINAYNHLNFLRVISLPDSNRTLEQLKSSS